MPFDNGKVSITSRHDLFPVELLDYQFQRVARSYGRLDMEVPPGIYMARCEVGGPAVERLVKVEPGQLVEVPFMEKDIYKQPSAAPVPGSVSRHEFYTDAAYNLARRPDPHCSLGSGARLVLFATRLDFAEKQDWETGARPVHWLGTKLRDSQGEVQLDLPGDEVRDAFDRECGRAGYCVDLTPGGYFLEWPLPETADQSVALQPLWLAAGWTTLVFAGATGEEPLPQRDTTSVHMTRFPLSAVNYDPEFDRINGAAELALASLRTGRRQLGDDHLRTLLYGKFANPMLGLLGAHMLLQRGEPSASLFAEVCANLRSLLGSHPDLLALEILGLKRFGRLILPEATFPSEVDFPPMLREGLTALDAAQWDQGQPLRLTAATKLARLRLLAEGPWTLFWHTVPVAMAIESVHNEASVPSKYGAPLVLAQAEATEDAQQQLRVYLKEFRERRGAHVLQLLDPYQLRWAGVNPEEAKAAIASATRKTRGLAYSPETLAQAKEIAEKIESLDKQLTELLQGGEPAERQSTPKPALKRRVSTPKKSESSDPPKAAEQGTGTLRPAVVAILKKSKNPLKTAEIYNALVAQGYKFTFKEAKKTLGIRLYKMLGVEPLGGGVFQAKRDRRP